jgi:hypothetical protein
MNPSLDKALYFLTNNGNFDDVSTDDLERLTKEHPYFSIGHLLLAKKLKIKDDQRFTQQVQKTALYFSNPYWLHYQLLNYPPGELDIYTEEKNNVDTTTATGSTEPLPDPAVPVETDTLTDVVIHQEHTADEGLEVTEVEEDTTNKQPEIVPITTVFTVDELNHASELAHQSLADTSGEDVDIKPGEPVAITNIFSADEIEHASQLAHESLSETQVDQVDINDHPETEDRQVDVIEEPAQSLIQPADEGTNDFTPQEEVTSETPPPFIEEDTSKYQPKPAPELLEAPEQESHEQHLVAAEEHTTQAEEEMAVIGREPEPSAEAFINEENKDLTLNEVIEKGVLPVEQPTEPDEHEVMFQNIKAMLDASAEEAGKETEGGVIPLDPYHTIDYFASQGIKLELDPNPQDKLGKQLKKFTHWLKHMKKLGPEDALESAEDAQAEADVQQIADTSNTAREVVTEAMATVLEKQGKKEKAVQLYIKLSFLNPDKSAYFADKIKKLKGI